MRFQLLIFRLKHKLKSIWNWYWAHCVASIIFFVKLFPAQVGIAFFCWFARFFGRFSSRHTVALDNLRRAYPEKDDAWIRQTALEMWENMGRLFAEYVFLDQIFDFDPNADKPGLVEVKGIDIFLRLKEEKKPHIFFTAHIGNFELLPICAATFGLNVTALFRPPNNPYIAKRVLKSRRTQMGHLVPSKAGAAWALAGKLADGDDVGMLVDQKFRRGIKGTFFKRPVKTNPLLIKLARQYDCDVYPARCIRLPGGRYRLELYERMELSFCEDNQIDMNKTAQKLNDIVEEWVREYPSQWMWFHKRWGE
ncbi:hypothetical protein MEG_00522 [Bartonella tamiae Th307]|uniref:Lipid A biosynthesis lauroyl acyltransferase n=2 Tax=Bartonella tamiae TaxID=373638 RepID=J0QZX6_9HYPH|nr:hypothetical protein ME5_01360 [Bartonella tamiae Th239]EJF94941.1 hypothetical protein MEG_00522 [Bartonella tamiae Th307]